MTGDPTIFATFSKQKGGRVTFGDNSKGKIIGVGMGTELEQSLNQFATFQNNSHDAVLVEFNIPDSQINFGKRLPKAGMWSDSNQFQESMDRSLRPQRDSVRQMMMRQEQIFQQQVSELHRLYKVQKTLMSELRSKQVKLYSRDVTPGESTDRRNMFWSSASNSKTSHSSHISMEYPFTDQLSLESSFVHPHNTRVGSSSQELRICSEDPLKIQKGLDLERPSVDDDIARVIQKQTPMLVKLLKEKMSIEGAELCDDGESDTELTLSIGRSANKKRSKNLHPVNNDLVCSMPTHSEAHQLILTPPVTPEDREEHGGSSESFNGGGLQGPPWLFQSLNLNNTS